MNPQARKRLLLVGFAGLVCIVCTAVVLFPTYRAWGRREISGLLRGCI